MKTKPGTQKPTATATILNHLDACGSMLSSLCAVHCLCLPLVASLLPALGLAVLANRSVERGLDATMVLFAAACLWLGCRVHRRWGLFGLLGAGVLLVGYVQLGASDRSTAPALNWMNDALMTIGGLLIAASHFLNRRLRTRCACTLCAAHEVKFNIPKRNL
jgi:hypothetical protein